MNKLEYYMGYTLDSNIELLYLIVIMAIILTIMLIMFNNMVISVLTMILVFILVGMFLILSNIQYIGYIYIVVYVGAIAILFIFVVMMLDLNISINEIKQRKNQVLELIVGIFISLIVIFFNIKEKEVIFNKVNGTNENIGNKLFEVFTIEWENGIYNTESVNVIGNNLYIYNDILLIIVGVLLLLSLIGAIRITIYKE